MLQCDTDVSSVEEPVSLLLSVVYLNAGALKNVIVVL